MTTKNLALSGLFIAIMLILGYFEKLLSLGLGYGIKLGLSNCVLLLCLYWFGIGPSLMLMVAKVLLTSILFGGMNPITLSLSLAGGILSMIGMILLVFVVKDISPVTAGVVGGVLHNVGQVLVAVYVHDIFVPQAYTATLVLVGAAMGGITGGIVVRLKHFLPYERRKQFGFAK
ncbi:MAG: Gx transporter family protein [Clostridiales bacterium]|nr:Gx transporter family protein [Clostridiales bacterium]